jgi:hypothetical protein
VAFSNSSELPDSQIEYRDTGGARRWVALLTSGNKSTSNGAAKPAPQPSTLPNNGPGEDIALFVGTTFIAATLHFMFTLRRAAKSA